MTRNKLGETDRYISLTERRIAQQLVVIERLAALGQSTTEPEKLLRELRSLLEILTERRRKVLRDIKSAL